VPFNRSFIDERSSRSQKTGPGSRGGNWHDPAYRAEYHRAWRRGNPEYRERERLRAARRRAVARGEDPTLLVMSPGFPKPLPQPAAHCECSSCSCRYEVVLVCGFCMQGYHTEATSEHT